MRNWLAGRGRWAGAVRRLKTTQRSVCVKRYSCTTENRESRKLVVRYVLLPFWGILPSQALESLLAGNPDVCTPTSCHTTVTQSSKRLTRAAALNTSPTTVEPARN
nr:uncharacterized protein LOC106822798 isoform X3 [Equus asinus]